MDFPYVCTKIAAYEPNLPRPHRAGPIPFPAADGRLGLLGPLGEEYSLGSHLHVVAGVPH